MPYKVYHKVWCDVPGCAESPSPRGDASPPQTVRFPTLGQLRAPGIPAGWVWLWREAMVLCPKHAVKVTIDGEDPAELQAAKAAVKILSQ